MDIWKWIFGNAPAVEISPKIVEVQHIFVISLGIPQRGYRFTVLCGGFGFTCGRYTSQNRMNVCANSQFRPPYNLRNSARA